MTAENMCLFLAIIVKVGQDQPDMLKGYWSTREQYFMAFYQSQPKKSLTQDTTDTGSRRVREFSAVCCTKIKEKRIKCRCQECHTGLCATPCVKVYQTKLQV